MTDETPIGQLLTERSKTHGDYATQSCLSQELKRVMSEAGVGRLTPAKRESLELIALKIARIIVGDENCADHWDDIAGYAKLAAKHK